MDNSVRRGQKVYSAGAQGDGLVKSVLGRRSGSHLIASIFPMKYEPFTHSERGDFSLNGSKIEL